jgi:aryl-alcohol dehydrogenase-like predicted oxidoreductase
MSVAYTGAGADDAESVHTIRRALELEVSLLDTAAVYGRSSTRNWLTE